MILALIAMIVLFVVTLWNTNSANRAGTSMTKFFFGFTVNMIALFIAWLAMVRVVQPEQFQALVYAVQALMRIR